MSAFKRKRTLAGTVREDDTYSIKFRWQGKQRLIQTGCTTKEDAEKQERDILKELRAGRIPNLLQELKQRQDLTIGQIITAYRAAGCPDRNRQPRTGAALERESLQLDTLEKWWSGKHPEHIGVKDCDQYHAWRCENKKRGTGDRTTEIELCTLSNVLHWAVRLGKIREHKLLHRPGYQNSKTIKHCRDFKPNSADELHIIGAKLFDNTKTEVLGWQFFLEAYTGMRSEEACHYLRWDAQRIGDNYQPGFRDEKYLYIQRVKHGINPQIVLDDPQRPHISELLAALRQWCIQRYPESPWFLPGCNSRGVHPVDKTILTKRIQEICVDLKLPPRTSHGLRAYYVTTRRGQGISDAQIAYEIGQGSGPELIRTTYGDPPLNWRGLSNDFTWLPKSDNIPVAWRRYQQTNIIALPAKAA